MGTLVCCVALIGGYLAWAGRSGVEAVDLSAEVEAAFAARGEVEAVPLEAEDRPTVARRPMHEKLAKRFFPIGKNINVHDRLSYYRGLPDFRREVTLDEHPLGGYIYETNGQGLRESTDVGDRPEFRILVTGDSHTDGAVGNDESFANVLEARLTEGGVHVDVLNAGRGGYHFLNYPGVLESREELRPDVFVIGVFGGNDFVEQLQVLRYFQGLGPLPTSDDFRRARERAWKVDRNLTAQSLRQVGYLGMFPAEIDLAVTGAVGATLSAADAARERGVDVVVVYLPAFVEAQPELVRADPAPVLSKYGLGLDSLKVLETLGDRYLAGLERWGVRAIDMRPVFAGLSDPAYWQEDHHLNVLGHRLTAEALLEALDLD